MAYNDKINWYQCALLALGIGSLFLGTSLAQAAFFPKLATINRL
ncbi:MAG: hypothetical protein WB988_26345 [Candidatus Nitrosopolaris sp.]